MMMPTQQKIHWLARALAILVFFLLGVPATVHAADPDLKPGDTIGPHNWERVKGMVGENLLNRIKSGYSFKIKSPKIAKPPKEYIAATANFSPQVKLGANGELLNYVAGSPFPEVAPSDPQIALKLIWNFY
ncbi:MAG: DUF1329 domain-containing protein, partial [Candidatus Binatia bacterium]